jgi:hypothetical protein
VGLDRWHSAGHRTSHRPIRRSELCRLVSDYSVLELANIAIAGFAAVSAVLLLLTYAVLIDVPGKSIYSMSSCVVLVAALTAIQIGTWCISPAVPNRWSSFIISWACSWRRRRSTRSAAGPFCRRKRFARFSCCISFRCAIADRQARLAPAVATLRLVAAIAAVSCDRPASYRPRNEAVLLQTVLE